MKRELVTYNGKQFVPYISAEEIDRKIRILADRLNDRFCDKTKTPPIFISMLNGAFMYTSDLLKYIKFDNEVSFVKYASYEDMSSTGRVNKIFGLNSCVSGRDIIVLDDIIDSGVTMMHFVADLELMNPESITVAPFIVKPHTCCKELTIDYPCIVMNDDKFIIGYGLDYNQLGRSLPEVYILKEE